MKIRQPEPDFSTFSTTATWLSLTKLTPSPGLGLADTSQPGALAALPAIWSPLPDTHVQPPPWIMASLFHAYQTHWYPAKLYV